MLEQVDVDFAGVLHRVILALALGRVELVAKKEHVSRFRVECFSTGVLRPELCQEVLEQVTGHLDNAVDDPVVRAKITDEFRAGIEVLERAAAQGNLDVLLTAAGGVGWGCGGESGCA